MIYSLKKFEQALHFSYFRHIFLGVEGVTKSVEVQTFPESN